MVQRIADFGGNVHTLYVAEMAHDCRFLLFFCTFESPNFSNIAFLICTFWDVEFVASTLAFLGRQDFLH